MIREDVLREAEQLAVRISQLLAGEANFTLRTLGVVEDLIRFSR